MRNQRDPTDSNDAPIDGGVPQSESDRDEQAQDAQAARHAAPRPASAPELDTALEPDVLEPDVNDHLTRRMALSALLDGEADTASVPVRDVLQACLVDEVLQKTWRGYNLVGAVMRKEYAGTAIDSLAARVHAAVAEESPLPAPHSDGARRQRNGTNDTDDTDGPDDRDDRHRRNDRTLSTPGAVTRHARALRRGPGSTSRSWTRPWRTAVAATAVAAVGGALWFSQDARQTGGEVAVKGSEARSTPDESLRVSETQAQLRAPAKAAGADGPRARDGGLPQPPAGVKRTELVDASTLKVTPILVAGDNVRLAPAPYAEMSPEEQRRWSSFLLQHAEYQGASAGSPVMPYIVLVGGDTR